MITEKDYPHFSYEEGREKFERFVRDFNIDAPTKLPRKERFKLWRDYRFPNYSGGGFDHVSFWKGTDEEYSNDIYYAVSQCYGSVDQVIENLQKDILLRSYAAKYYCEITVYGDNRYNWHNDNMVFVLFKLNEPWRVEVEKEPPLLEITVR